MSKITHVEVRMYKLGTGDCFTLKFFSGKNVKLTMMIDAGTWSAGKDKLNECIEDLKRYFGNKLDILVVTHEHKDHVHAFGVCESLFTDNNFKIGEIWLGWPEEDGDPKVEEWKKQYGEKKKALGLAARRINELVDSTEFKEQYNDYRYEERTLKARRNYGVVLKEFADLHLSVDDAGQYKGGQTGMEVVKNKIKATKKFFRPGETIVGPNGCADLKFFVLGPPLLYDSVKKEAGATGESYDHNKILKKSDAFGLALDNLSNSNGIPSSQLLPFEDHFIDREPGNLGKAYKDEPWRKIDFDWIFSSGTFALRMSSLTNNLSLALAIEIGDEKKVLLFPGDAEFGSWSSWHTINWNRSDDSLANGGGKKHFTEDLLNRTVFYKVAHHLSHNGTAQKLGLEMMNHEDLVAMATVDYDAINSGWKSTMPNRAIVKELLKRTKGRLIIMNEKNLYYDFNEQQPLSAKIKEGQLKMSDSERKRFESDYSTDGKIYHQYIVRI